jgi:hypothetical protein
MIKNKYYTSPYYISWAVKDTVGKENKIRLQNLSDVNIQNKAGNGQIEVLERDTTGTDAKINLKAVKLATADSSHMNRVVVSDTLQGVVLFTSEGARYRLRVSPTGVLTAVVVP